MENRIIPDWSNPVADYGNVACKVCNKIQASSFKACIYCCNHDELELVEEWHGPDDDGGWELDVECLICGKNFDFQNEQLVNEYKLVRKRS